MEERNIIHDCSRGCTTERLSSGELNCKYHSGCCKLNVNNWLEGISQAEFDNMFEVRFKNTRKQIYTSTPSLILSIGDIVVVEANAGYDVGIITLRGPVVKRQLIRNKITDVSDMKKIHRKAKTYDIEKWQSAIQLEHRTMIRARQIANELKLNMKIGDVEYQGDSTKAIFYYIADERVDFRQLIKVFADEFKIRIEMKQIGARQEAGLIGGLGVCGRELCCSNYISNFQSISTQTARQQDLSLNPQKLAGQCSKLKCCINYEAATYIDAQSKLPRFNSPLTLEDGQIYLMKTDILKGIMWFSYDPNSMSNMIQLKTDKVKEILKLIHRGKTPKSILEQQTFDHKSEFISSVGDEKIDRFDKKRTRKKRPNRNKPQAKQEK